MPRKRRFILPNIPHHAIQRGNNRQDVYFDQEDRDYYFRFLHLESSRNRVRIGAYCLMTNHIHLLLYPEDATGLVRMMKSVSQNYTQYANKKYRRSGKLWENRYELHLVDPDRQWWLARYIEKNPLRARMVKQAEDYPYSSARGHLLGEEDKILSYDILGAFRDPYRKFFEEISSEEENELHRLREVIQQEKAFGGQEFLKK
jgi:putative transposase